MVENWCALLNVELVSNSKGLTMYHCIVGRMRSQHEHAGDARSMFAYSYCLACVLACMFRIKEGKSKEKVKVEERQRDRTTRVPRNASFLFYPRDIWKRLTKTHTI